MVKNVQLEIFNSYKYDKTLLDRVLKCLAVVYKYISDLIIVDCKTDQSLCISSSTQCFFFLNISLVLQTFVTMFCFDYIGFELVTRSLYL